MGISKYYGFQAGIFREITLKKLERSSRAAEKARANPTSEGSCSWLLELWAQVEDFVSSTTLGRIFNPNFLACVL